MMKSVPSLQRGNRKLGKNKTWNINLPPHLICIGRKCFEEGCCYNFKAWRLYPSTKLSWVKNWLLFFNDSETYFDHIIGRIQRSTKPLKYFRWQAAGDIPNQIYLEGMKRVARSCPNTKFLVFTKNFDLTFKEIPKNLEIAISAWPGVKLPKHLRARFPVAWFIDGRETRYGRKEVIDCPGQCEKCRKCWNLSKTNKDVKFLKH